MLNCYLWYCETYQSLWINLNCLVKFSLLKIKLINELEGKYEV